jgi:predicted RNA-binding protein (virulence factor B family)
MINIGDFYNMKVARCSGIGCYLDAETGRTSDDVLLPKSGTLGQDLKIGDEVKAFIYRDSNDRIIATLKEPLAKVGDIAYLEVVSTTGIGAFVDIGLDKDILVPMKERTYKLETGRKYLFYIYVDKTGRLAATANIDKHLTNTEDYRVGDEVTGICYGFQTNGSAMIAVDNLYRGVILKNEYYNPIAPGDGLALRVKKHYEDGKMALTPRKPPQDERLKLQETILEYLNSHGGFMPFNDRTSPVKIEEVFHQSKKYFKNALGGLMKQGLILQDETGTRLKK